MASAQGDDLQDSQGGAVKLSSATDAEKKDILYRDPNKFKLATYAVTTSVVTQQEVDDGVEDPLTGGSFISQPYTSNQVGKPKDTLGRGESSNRTAFVYTPNIVPFACEFDKYGATCQCTIEDPVNTNLSDSIYTSGTYGFKYDVTTTDRHRILVTMLGDDQEFPDPDEPPTYNIGKAGEKGQNVLFSGYNKTGAEISVGGGPGDRVSITYSGIEQALNDLTVSGVVLWDLSGESTYDSDAEPSSGDSIPPTNADKYTVHSYSSKAVFNKGGFPNRMNFDGGDLPFIPTVLDAKKGAEAAKYAWFNNSGEGPVSYWSLGDILNYLLNWYVCVQANITKGFPDTFDIKTNFREYLYLGEEDACDFNIPADLFNEIPTDFSLEGIGVYQAIVETVNQSRSYDIELGYDINGRARLTYVPKINRDTSKFQVTVSRGGFGEDYDSNKILLNSNLFVNRDHSTLGRVIVIGAKVILNTLCTTFSKANSELTFSSNEDTYSATLSGIDNLDDLMGLYIKDDLNAKGLAGHIYYVTPTQFINIPLPLTSGELNDDSKNLIFDHFDVPEILDHMQPAFSERHKQVEDFGLYVSDAIDVDAALGLTWIFIKPAENSNTFDVDIAPSNSRGQKLNGAVKIAEKGFENDKTVFNDYEESSDLDPSVQAWGKYLSSVFRTPLPFFLRCSIRTPYRLKGIAKIDGFNPKIHKTLIVNDDRFELSLNYKNHHYGPFFTPVSNLGSFTKIPDGLIPLKDGSPDPAATKPITSIQEQAEGLLEKYVTIPQNSGELKLKGIQPAFRVGQFITEIEGGDRTIDFPATIIGVRYDFKRYLTYVELGNVFDQDQSTTDDNLLGSEELRETGSIL